MRPLFVGGIRRRLARRRRGGSIGTETDSAGRRAAGIGAGAVLLRNSRNKSAFAQKKNNGRAKTPSVKPKRNGRDSRRKQGLEARKPIAPGLKHLRVSRKMLSFARNGSR
jgi:hypothetical protein